jgi:Transcriptional regulator, AbiEi antitoxin
MRPQSITAEQVIARLASRAHGVVTREELRRAGITPGEIKSRLRIGALIRVHPGVYRVGHRAPSVEARYTAAVKACGGGAALVGRAGAHLFELLDGRTPAPEVAARSMRRVRGVTTRRSARTEAVTFRGIRVATVPEILVDLAASLSLDDLARACHVAGIRYRVRPEHVDAVLHRRPNAAGAKKLRAVLHGDAPVLLSRLEERFRTLLREAVLPLPRTNRPAGSKYVDCRWPDHRLTVELLSYTFHNSRHAWENDQRRQREAYERGDRFRTYTYDDVFERPALVLAELRTLLR